MNYPLVSLIMTTYNSQENFRASIESALSQDYPNIEIIVIDGGSTDDTLNLIKEYSEKISKGAAKCSFKWVSEPDNGIYDAMNKGICMANGEIIAVFNDLFSCTNAISTFAKMIYSNGCDAVHSDLAYISGNRWVRYWHMPKGNLYTGWMPAHPTLYIRREVYDKYGLYETRYSSSSDYEFMIRILKDKSLNIGYIPKVMIKMFYGGTSSNGIKGYSKNIKEAYLALHDNDMYFPCIIIFCRILRTIWQYKTAAKAQKEIEGVDGNNF